LGVNASRPQRKYLILVDLLQPSPNWQILSEIEPLLAEQECKILALISTSEERSIVFQSGVYDYILFPLLPNEMRTRIQTCALSLEAFTSWQDPTQSSRVFEQERIAIVGRLASTIAHEIGNSMQVIRGALALATESPDELQEVLEYVQLSYQESERVVHLIATLREVYQSQLGPVSPISVDSFLERQITLVKHETEKQNVELNLRLPQQLAALKGVGNQLFLAFLSILLNIIDVIGKMGGGRLDISGNEQNAMINIIFSINIPIGWHDSTLPTKDYSNAQFIPENSRGVFLVARKIILAHDGTMTFSQDNGGFDLQVSLPAWQAPS